jgi:proteasome assembly chaperone (PAC2) family protein
MDALRWESDPPQLESPILVCAFRGWNDAAGAATGALSAIGEEFDPELTAVIDPEEFFDFQAQRPTITLTEGQTRHIEWPGNLVIVAQTRPGERDLVLLDGTEPNLRWRTFSEAIAEAAERLGVEMVITLGALLAEVAHTMPVPITGLASDESLVESLDLNRSNYEGPTGIVGVLHDTFRRRDIPSASLWAAVPHYVAAVPNPKASLALLRRLEGLTGVAVEASELESEVESFERQINAAVEANDEIKELVERIEQQQSEQFGFGEEVPSAEAIAREFQRFLRQRGTETN